MSSISKQDIKGVRTDVAILNFSDRVFVTISQLAKFGTVVSKEFSVRMLPAVALQHT